MKPSVWATRGPIFTDGSHVVACQDEDQIPGFDVRRFSQRNLDHDPEGEHEPGAAA